MTPDELRALADAIVYRDSLAIARAADYLRACAEAEPIGYFGRDADEDVWMEMESWATNAIPLYAHPAPAAPEIKERGPWTERHTSAQVWIEEADQAHDLRLYVSGIMESNDQRIAYAQEIARRLNAAPAAPQEK